VAVQASNTRYQHQEVEGDGVVGTTFKSTGQELRVQANQAPLALAGGTLRGVLGLQTESLDFSALGEEAFVPGTRTRSQALFTLQELALGAATLQAGVRLEKVKVHSDGDAAAPRRGGRGRHGGKRGAREKGCGSHCRFGGKGEGEDSISSE
jgi:iron complex outermembrane receptor protein